MQQSFANILAWLDTFSILLGIVTAVPIIWTWLYLVMGDRLRQRRWLREIRRYTGERPSVLIIDLLRDKDVSVAVRRDLPALGLKDISDDRIFAVSREKAVTVEDMGALAREVRAAVAQGMTAGTDVFHVFYAGPVTAGMVVGVELASCSARLYMHDKETGRYVFWGPVRYP